MCDLSLFLLLYVFQARSNTIKSLSHAWELYDVGMHVRNDSSGYARKKDSRIGAFAIYSLYLVSNQTAIFSAILFQISGSQGGVCGPPGVLVGLQGGPSMTALVNGFIHFLNRSVGVLDVKHLDDVYCIC